MVYDDGPCRRPAIADLGEWLSHRRLGRRTAGQCECEKRPETGCRADFHSGTRPDHRSAVPQHSHCGNRSSIEEVTNWESGGRIIVMNPRPLVLLSPYRPPTSYPVSLSDGEAAGWLNGYFALWHPAVLRGSLRPPDVASS